MPEGFPQAVNALPLSQASSMIRGIATENGFSPWGIGILLIYLAVFSVISFLFIYRKKNL